MKRRICAWMLAAAAALSLTTPVTAAVSRKIVNPVHFYADKDGDGICDNFTDKNKDGICDNCAWGRGQGRYAGSTAAGILRTKTETAFVTIMQTAAAGDMAVAEAWGMDVAGFSARLFWQYMVF